MKDFSPEILDKEGYGILFARVASYLIDEGKIDQATLISEVGIKKFPNYAQGHFLLAKCYAEKDMFEEARTEYERVLKYDSSHMGAMWELANIFRSNGLDDVYKDYLFRLLTLDPLNNKIIDEAREQGVYDLWKMDGKEPFSQVERIKPGEFGGEAESTEEDKKSEVLMQTDSEEEELSAKIDLSQFENQDDDFNTIMDGLIQDSADVSEEIDVNNYMKELETTEDSESELLAEEKPVAEKDEEISSETDFEFADKGEPFLEMDFSDEQEKKEEIEPKPEPEENAKLIDDIKPDTEEIEEPLLDSIDNLETDEENIIDLDKEVDTVGLETDNITATESDEKTDLVDDVLNLDKEELVESESDTDKILDEQDQELPKTEDNVLNLDEEEITESESDTDKIFDESSQEILETEDNILDLDKELESEKPDLQPEELADEHEDADSSAKESLSLEMEPEPDEIIEESSKLVVEEPEIQPESEKPEAIDEVEEESLQEETIEEESPYVKQKIVSQTLGEILVSQKKYKEARQVFVALKQQQPDNKNIDKKIEILDKIIDLENDDN